MNTRNLGPNGPSVGAIGIGGMPMSTPENRPDPAHSARVLLRAFELGATLWDTADAYSQGDHERGHNETIFADAWSQLSQNERETVVIATKGGWSRPDGAWIPDGRPEALRQAIDGSLRRLKTECISLYQFHWPDPKTPFVDSVGAIAQAQSEGKIRFVGLSNVSVEQIDAARAIVPIQSVQNRYSWTHRAPETDGVLAHCEALGITFLPWSPLGGIQNAAQAGDDSGLARVAQKLGVSPQRAALAWLLQKGARVIPIPGATRFESLEDSLSAAQIEADVEAMANAPQ